LNNFRLITISHKTANINHVGKYIPAFNDKPEQLVAVLTHIKQTLEVDELLYLATCNRLTFLFVKDNPVDEQFLIQLFSMLHKDIPEHCIKGILQIASVFNGEECIKHIFEVASSLDSLVVGEREIIRQLRTAYDFCSQHELTGDNIRLVIKHAIPVAKEVYTHTKIGENSVSVVSLAMQEMMRLNPAQESRFLIIGAGQTNNLAAKFLVKHGFKHFDIFNRSQENAKLLAQKLDGNSHLLTELPHYNKGFDIIITCTGATDAIVTKEIYQNLLQGDTETKIIVDLAVPTDIDPEVVAQYPIHYIAVERLRQVAAENLLLRKQEMLKAQAIIAKRVEEFRLMLRQRRVERAMSTEIPARMKAVKEKALYAVFNKEIAALDQEAQDVLSKVVDYLEKKYIGIPIAIAKGVLESELMSQPT
jgi:glutamyl-tRNA reductase